MLYAVIPSESRNLSDERSECLPTRMGVALLEGRSA
jgi:hypothetical protein